MSEWWTYSLSDFLLFSPRTYYRLFELYNVAILPLQVLALALGAAILFLLLRDTAWRGRAVAAILAACWLWVAGAYLLARYDTINWAASYFAVGFAIEALLLVWAGIIRDRLRFRPRPDWVGGAGIGIFLFALAVYPLIGRLIGRPWLQVEVFGVMPDPTAIATLAVLVAARRPHWLLLVIPLLWCAISGATLWSMAAPDALIVPAAALIAFALTVWKSLVSRGAGSTSLAGANINVSRSSGRPLP
jgi:uncharacterized protein DUF6064